LPFLFCAHADGDVGVPVENFSSRLSVSARGWSRSNSWFFLKIEFKKSPRRNFL
jgi:hypothetical protein